MYRALSRWSCWRKAARGVRLPRLIPPSEPTWASSDEAAISNPSPSWHCMLLLFLSPPPNSVFSNCDESAQTRWWQPPQDLSEEFSKVFHFFQDKMQHLVPNTAAPLLSPMRRSLCVGDVNPCLEMKRTASLWLREAIRKQFGYNWHGFWKYI